MTVNTIFLIKWDESYPKKIDSEELFCTKEEVRHGGKFRRNDDKVAYLLGRSNVRQICSDVLGVSPASLSISKNSYGRPFLTDYAKVIDFNISHSGSMLAIGVSTEGKIGIDLEMIKSLDIKELNSFFTNEETEYIENSNSDKIERLLQVWTSIEAYSKLLGIGLNMQIKNRHFITINKNQAQIRNDQRPVYINSYKINQYILSIAKEKKETKFEITERLLT